MSDTAFSPAVYERRREKLRAQMAQAGHKALLVSHPANRFYLSGFELFDSQCTESSGMLFIAADGRDKLLTDPRFLDAARRLWPEEDIFIYSGQRLVQIRRFLAGLVGGPVAFEPRSMSVEAHTQLSEGLVLTPVLGLVESLRRIKEPAEVERLERSCRLNQRVMERIVELAEPGLTEAGLAWRLERAFRDLGATQMAFAPIVAVDANAALPHAQPGAAVVGQECCLLVDMGGRLDDYCSDQTRTVWIGQRPPSRFRRTLELTQKAQAEAIAILKPGLPAAEAYRTAMTFFEANGEGRAFTHALGHGIGLETHEGVSLSPVSKEVLEPGMVVTVEPGLYYPEWGGVRWEHTVLITEDGCRVLGRG